VGTVAALNTAGGIAGTLLTGFVLVPSLGLVRTLGALALAGAVLGAVAILRSRRRRAAGAAAVLVLGVALLAVVTPRDRLVRLLAEKRGGTLVFYEENAGGTVAVLEQRPPVGEGASFRRLYIQGVSNSGDALSSLRYMRLQALLPLLVHPGEPRSALVVGFGTGITAGGLLEYPGSRPASSRNCFRRWCVRVTCSRATTVRRETPASTSASVTGDRNCCAGRSATTSSRSSRRPVGGGGREPLLPRLL